MFMQQMQFQSRTGSPGHLAAGRRLRNQLLLMVSIPDGLPRPFSQGAM